jgi:hypothetical protein
MLMKMFTLQTRLQQSRPPKTLIFITIPLKRKQTNLWQSIIVVHGLGGHAVKSWQSRTNSKLWLIDFLPEDISNVRIMTYGYDTKLHTKDGEEHHGKKSINSIAKSMLEEICTVRDNKAV